MMIKNKLPCAVHTYAGYLFYDIRGGCYCYQPLNKVVSGILIKKLSYLPMKSEGVQLMFPLLCSD